VTSSNVHLPSYIGRLDDVTEQPRFPAGPRVCSVEPRIPKRPEVGSEEPQIPNRPRGGWEVFGPGVACTWNVVSR
jgi:hypothetical protein